MGSVDAPGTVGEAGDALLPSGGHWVMLETYAWEGGAVGMECVDPGDATQHGTTAHGSAPLQRRMICAPRVHRAKLEIS